VLSFSLIPTVPERLRNEITTLWRYTNLFIIIIVIIINSSHELSPRTLNSELDLDTVKANSHANYLGQRPFRSTVVVHTYRQTD